MELIISRYAGIGNSTHDVISLPEKILIEILSRLPTKSLMRFKSVCKYWFSLIKQDQHLLDLHFNHWKSSPNLLHINPFHKKGVLRFVLESRFEASETLQQSISCAEMVGGSGGEEQVQVIVSKDSITDDKWFYYSELLEPVNGLVCFVYSRDNTHAVKVYNASTREATSWVKSTLLAEENDKLSKEDNTIEIKSLHSAIYRFGFDPEKKEHKVFCFWRLVARRQGHHISSMEHHDYEGWEALTVGRDTKWRRINAVPYEYNKIKIKEALPSNSITRQVYADGTIYWSNKEYHWDPLVGSNPEDPDVIVAFDVGSEKYRVIPVPNFILDEPRDVRRPIGMLVMGGQVALLYQMEPYVVKLWMLDDRSDKKTDKLPRKPK